MLQSGNWNTGGRGGEGAGSASKSTIKNLLDRTYREGSSGLHWMLSFSVAAIRQSNGSVAENLPGTMYCLNTDGYILDHRFSCLARARLYTLELTVFALFSIIKQGQTSL